MTPREIRRLRLANLQVATPSARGPADVVMALGAVQAQDFSAALWAIGLRSAGATRADVERAIAGRSIVRTWPMRGTLHFVAAADVRWMLELLTPRVLAGSRKRQLELELDAPVFARCREVFVKALEGGRQLTREAMLAALENAGISTGSHRGYHILWRLAQEQLICFATRNGSQPTFALLDEWVPASRRFPRDESLAELARRYFTSHGPATLADFVWWSGLKVADARAGVDLAGGHLVSEIIGGRAHWLVPSVPPGKRVMGASADLLPGFDEYLLGYQDRSAALDPRHASRIVPGGNGIFRPMLVIDGRIEGVWKSVVGKTAVRIAPSPFRPLKTTETRTLAAAAARYGKFLGLEVRLDGAGGEFYSPG